MPSDIDRTEWRRPPTYWDRGYPLANEWHGPVWHYTSEDGLRGILESSVLWATESGRLNDREEVAFGIEECERIWREVRGQVIDQELVPGVDEWLASVATRAARRKVFIVAASYDGDSLNHWGRYCPEEGGFAIAFDREQPFRVLAPPRRNPVYIPNDVPAAIWQDVEYGQRNLEWDWPRHDPTRVLFDMAIGFQAKHREGSSRATRNEMCDFLDQRFLSLVYTFKSEPWRPELEVRLVAVAPPVAGAVKRREVRGSSTRYLELTAAAPDADDSHYVVAQRQPLPIQAIRIGPRPVVGTVTNRVRRMLNDAGYRGLQVQRSEARVRYPRSTAN